MVKPNIPNPTTSNLQLDEPDHTAVRVALWRALHVLIDPKPHIFTDEIGSALTNENNWRNRPDMDADFSKSMRASIVARSRFIEDLVDEQANLGLAQYLILGAGLDTFAQRRPDIGPHLQVFEVDKPGPQAWKQKRLAEAGFPAPSWEQLVAAGFDASKPTIVVSAGVSIYLTKEANLVTFQQMAKLAPRSIFAITFLHELDLLDTKERSMMEFVMNRAEESGTPFLSLFTPSAILELANKAGFKSSKYVSAGDLYQRYFSERTDGLHAGNAEGFLVSMT